MKIGCLKSYSRAEIYSELSGKIEKFSKWAYFCLVYANVIGILIPPSLLSFVNYYIYDLGDESFELVSPIMYVKNVAQNLSCFSNRRIQKFALFRLVEHCEQAAMELENTVWLCGCQHFHFNGMLCSASCVNIDPERLCGMLPVIHRYCSRYFKWCITFDHWWSIESMPPQNERTFLSNHQTFFDCETVEWNFQTISTDLHSEFVLISFFNFAELLMISMESTNS